MASIVGQYYRGRSEMQCRGFDKLVYLASDPKLKIGTSPPSMFTGSKELEQAPTPALFVARHAGEG